MNEYGGRHAVSRYQEVGVRSQVADASPHQLVQMMLDGALARTVAARGAVDAGETALKGERIGKAIGLVEGLRASLDMERGGEVAANLFALYEYMGRRLLEANLRDDAGILDEVAALLRELQAGWRAIGPEVTAARTAV